MRHTAHRIAALSASGLVGAVLLVGLAGPAAAADGSGSAGLFGPLFGDRGLISVFIGNYQVNN